MENVPFNPKILGDSSKFHKHRYAIFSFLIIGFIFFVYYLFFSTPRSFPVNYKLQIEQGETLHAISNELKRNNVIRSSIAFEAFVIFYNAENSIVAGDYLFEKNMPVWQVARRISKNVRFVPSVIVAIPEGYDIYQIADTYASKLSLFSKEKFLAYAKTKEGYFFPDTYYFLNNDTEKNVIDSMSKNFEKKLAPIRPNILASGKSEKDIITMASIIERESRGYFDRKEISGILWKRISIGMRLQVDAAPVTYQAKGLPTNPISNPGLEAIDAAINPKISNYLYYLHDKDGNIHYAKTFGEHKANIAKYLTK
ncbi:MAG: endolytic transglycosylase MltG [Patescibacteria group bacterium]